MIALEIDNKEIEKIYLEAFNQNKEKFFEFIKSSYKNFIKKSNKQDEIDFGKFQIESFKDIDPIEFQKKIRQEW